MIAARKAALTLANEMAHDRLQVLKARPACANRPKVLTLRDAPALLKAHREQQKEQQSQPMPVRHYCGIKARPRTAGSKPVSFPHEGRSPWGFFKCALQSDAAGGEATGADTVLVVGAPDVEGCATTPVVLSRPSGGISAQHLQYGPFAFRLSPSSEVLAWLACTMLKRMFAGKHILELGSGLGLTGLTVASWCGCASVRLTDGDPQAVSVIARNVALNAERGAFGSTEATAATLLWGNPNPTEDAQHEKQSYDLIIAADVVYDRLLHAPLLQTIKRWLSPSGVAIVVCSRRCGSLSDFERCAQRDYTICVDAWPQEYDAAVTARFRGQKCFPNVITLKHRLRQSSSNLKAAVAAARVVRSYSGGR